MSAEDMIAKGREALDAGHYNRAVTIFTKAIKENPTAPRVYNELARAHISRGRFSDAYFALLREIKNNSKDPEVFYNTGLTAMNMERPDEAIAHFTKALELQPDNGACYNNMCMIYVMKSENEKALELVQKAATILPNSFEVWNNYHAILKHLGRFEEAVEKLEKAYSLAPNDISILNNLGLLYRDVGRVQDAEMKLKKSVELGREQKRIEGFNILADLFLATGRRDDAIKLLEESKSIDPNFYGTYGELGNIFAQTGQFKKSEESYRNAMRLRPNDAGVLNNYATVLLAQGKLDETEELLKEAVTIDTDSMSARKNMLLIPLYKYSDPEKIWKSCVEHNEATKKHYVKRDFKNTLDPNKKLRIGYVTSDFRAQPVGRNMLPVFQMHDRTKFELYSYVDLPNADHVSQMFMNLSDKWTTIGSYSDKTIAEMIEADQVDIMVSTALRFDRNKNILAAMKPAPINVSIHDPGSSGIENMDYLITDITLSPKKTQEKFYERVLHLPTFYTHMNFGEDIDINELPSIKNGFITFGSSNNPAKITSETLDLWARVLKEVPNSKLLLKYRDSFNVGDLRDLMITRFKSRDIDESRLIFRGGNQDNTKDHMALYHDVDICLDTTPFTGSTTTFEAVWMGIPVVTLAGPTMVQRWSTAIARKIGHMDWVANTADEYVSIAKRLSNDRNYLEEVRNFLRLDVVASPLYDSQVQSRQLERFYRAMWKKYCREQSQNS